MRRVKSYYCLHIKCLQDNDDDVVDKDESNKEDDVKGENECITVSAWTVIVRFNP